MKKKKQPAQSFTFSKARLKKMSEVIFTFSIFLGKQIWEFILIIKDWLVAYSEVFDDFFPSARAIIQVSCIYFFACVDLVYSIATFIFSLGTNNGSMSSLYPVISKVLNDPTLMFIMSPEKVFIFSYLAIEICIVQNTFQFTKLVRYNILLVYSLLMLQGTSITFWDMLFNRQIPESSAAFAWGEGFLTGVNRPIGTFFFTVTFVFYLTLYAYCYSCAFVGRFPKFPKGFTWITDSIAFWMRIRTNTMPYGKRRKKFGGEK